MTDTAYLAAILSDGCWHSHSEILELSFVQRGHGLTVHSRAADLRKRGHVVETRLDRDRRGRTLSFYRFVLDEAAASPEDQREVTDGLTAVSSSTPPTSGTRSLSPAALACEPSTGGVLPLFDCEIDESAGLRGAYGDAA